MVYKWHMASQNHIDDTRPKYQLELLQILKSNQKLLKVRIPFLYDNIWRTSFLADYCFEAIV